VKLKLVDQDLYGLLFALALLGYNPPSHEVGSVCGTHSMWRSVVLLLYSSNANNIFKRKSIWPRPSTDSDAPWHHGCKNNKHKNKIKKNKNEILDQVIWTIKILLPQSQGNVRSIYLIGRYKHATTQKLK
jgi:hypothetical protein